VNNSLGRFSRPHPFQGRGQGFESPPGYRPRRYWFLRLLSTRSDEFRVLWASHDVRFHRSGIKRFHHPLVGDLTLAYESLELAADPGLTLVTYSPTADSGSADALDQLARWSATRDRLSAVKATAPA
jgi:transcription regulator MmyB-like protein